jgi:hypothetical protein
VSHPKARARAVGHLYIKKKRGRKELNVDKARSGIFVLFNKSLFLKSLLFMIICRSLPSEVSTIQPI